MRNIFMICAVVLAGVEILDAAEPRQTNRTSISFTNFEPNLPIVYLDATEPIVSERKVPCRVRLALPGGNQLSATGALAGEVRFHGASSQQYAKKSFGVTLGAPTNWLGLRESRHWVLNAAFVDRSLMRHKLSYDLFRSLSSGGGSRFAAASRFVELNLNGKYRGAYLLMERVDRALLELRSFDSNAPAQACIYKAVDHAANFSHRGHAGYEQREPDPLVREYWRPLDDFNRFASGAPGAEFFAPETGIASRLDLDNAIDFQLLVLLTSNMDGITKNFMIARDAPSAAVPSPKFFFAPWDYDGTFGRNWDASRVEPTAWLSNHLFDRLHKDENFRKKFATRWKQLRAKEFSMQTIHGMIDNNVRTLGEASQRNAARWKTLDGPYPDRLSLEEDVTQMKAWVVARLAWLDQEIGALSTRGK